MQTETAWAVLPTTLASTPESLGQISSHLSPSSGLNFTDSIQRQARGVLLITKAISKKAPLQRSMRA